MGYWLLKADPDDYGWSHLERDGRAVWDGVTNPLALRHMREALKGDAAFLYHTGRDKAVVGLAEITSDPTPDPGDARLVVFEVTPRRRLQRPVTLAAIKADPRFADFALVRMSRLSVMPVPAAVWQRLLKMAGEKA